MTPEQATQLDAHETFIHGFRRTGRTCRQFWAEFDFHSKGVNAAAMEDDALADRYFDQLDSAHDAFPAVPDSMDEVME